ncbi:MAG: hypothetical protein KGL35_10205 [Bradyrhizobium sp.]|nr:hypothetical protein [Bradyrhizobium sp.]
MRHLAVALLGRCVKLYAVPKSNPARKRIREVLLTMPGVADTNLLARQALELMSDSERVEALISLLPRLVREEDRRLGKAGDSWLAATERRVRLNGEDMFLGDADEEQVDQLASIRERAASNIQTAAGRFRELAGAMRLHEAETVSALGPDVGLPILRGRLRDARRRIANRDSLVGLKALADEATESFELQAANERVAKLQARFEAAQRERAQQEMWIAAIYDGLPPSVAPLLERLRERLPA